MSDHEWAFAEDWVQLNWAVHRALQKNLISTPEDYPVRTKKDCLAYRDAWNEYLDWDHLAWNGYRMSTLAKSEDSRCWVLRFWDRQHRRYANVDLIATGGKICNQVPTKNATHKQGRNSSRRYRKNSRR